MSQVSTSFINRSEGKIRQQFYSTEDYTIQATAQAPVRYPYAKQSNQENFELYNREPVTERSSNPIYYPSYLSSISNYKPISNDNNQRTSDSIQVERRKNPSYPPFDYSNNNEYQQGSLDGLTNQPPIKTTESTYWQTRLQPTETTTKYWKNHRQNTETSTEYTGQVYFKYSEVINPNQGSIRQDDKQKETELSTVKSEVWLAPTTYRPLYPLQAYDKNNFQQNNQNFHQNNDRNQQEINRNPNFNLQNNNRNVVNQQNYYDENSNQKGMNLENSTTPDENPLKHPDQKYQIAIEYPPFNIGKLERESIHRAFSKVHQLLSRNSPNLFKSLLLFSDDTRAPRPEDIRTYRITLNETFNLTFQSRRRRK